MVDSSITAGNIDVSIEKELKKSYIDYAMSVIVGRALPSVLDGLKPVQRRILYSMYETGSVHDKPFKKSARTVGDVLGKYHPHSDTAVYDALVRMAQPFTMRYPLIDGQGNFGSIDGDSAAAMRYTEARLTAYAEEMLADIEKDTVLWANNFDNSLQEPLSLPSKVPNLILNGSSGIAVGMATYMVPHNITEVGNALLKYIDNEEISADELLSVLPGPDFPTGGIIYGKAGIRNYFLTGKGQLTVRSKIEIKQVKEKQTIIIKELPYNVNKASMLQSIVELKNDKTDEIQDVRDESDRDGISVVIELRKGANAELIENMLYKHTKVESVINVNNVVLVDGRPFLLSMKDLFKYYLQYRRDIIIRRSKFTLKKNLTRINILNGILIAINNIDEVVALIKGSRDAEEAKGKLQSRFSMNEEQAKSILEMRLQRLTALESENIKSELDSLTRENTLLEVIIGSVNEQNRVIREEIQYLIKKFGDRRRTEIVEMSDEIMDEDLIPNVQNLIVFTNSNYIKRIPMSIYRDQKRGGHGSKTMEMKEEDEILLTVNAMSHDYLLLFSNYGKVYKFKCYTIPASSKQGRGKPIVQMLPVLDNSKGERIETIIPLSKTDDNFNLFFCTRNGIVKSTPVSEFRNIRSSGIRAIGLKEGDKLIKVELYRAGEYNNAIICTKKGLAIRFDLTSLRSIGRSAMGVRGIRLNPEDEVKYAEIARDSDYLLSISEKGSGKRTLVSAYRKVHRGCKGVRTMKLTAKNGELVSIKIVNDNHDLVITTKNGKTIKIDGSKIKLESRNTIGVKLINLDKDDSVASVDTNEHTESVKNEAADTHQ